MAANMSSYGAQLANQIGSVTQAVPQGVTPDPASANPISDFSNIMSQAQNMNSNISQISAFEADSQGAIPAGDSPFCVSQANNLASVANQALTAFGYAPIAALKLVGSYWAQAACFLF